MTGLIPRVQQADATVLPMNPASRRSAPSSFTTASTLAARDLRDTGHSARFRSQADRPETVALSDEVGRPRADQVVGGSDTAGGVALAFDAANQRVPFSVLASGVLDEVAHLVTGALGLLALACFIDPPGRFYVAGLIASVAVDLDHIPLYLGLGNPEQRPVTHSLTTVLVIVVAAVLSRRMARVSPARRPGC